MAEFVGRFYSLPLVLLVWEALARSGAISRRLMPSLVDIAKAFVDATASGDLPYHAGISLFRALSGYGLAVVLGILLGTAMARSRLIDALFEPIFSVGYPVPKIALYPIFIFVFGLGFGSKVALIFLECLYPVAISTYYGMRSVERVHLWTARNMGASPRDVFWRILLPASAPAIFAGLRIALPISLIIVIVTELIGESRGLGHYVSYQSASFEYAGAFAGIAAVSLIGFVLDRLLVLLRNRVIFWEKGATLVGAA